jgi:apolipoprotein N-acyltransferase
MVRKSATGTAWSMAAGRQRERRARQSGQPYLIVASKRVAFSICYEDFQWWPNWRLLIERSNVLVGMSNGWVNSDLAIDATQRQSVESIARLTGVPLLRVANR